MSSWHQDVIGSGAAAIFIVVSSSAVRFTLPPLGRWVGQWYIRRSAV